MRTKRKKQYRRTVRFFKTCFAFRQPYKILCDGTFLHRFLDSSLGSADDALSKLLGGLIKVFVTRCVSDELKKLGEPFSETLTAARKLNAARCEHEPSKSAAECIENMVGSDNPERFFIATQDLELRKKFRQIPGVPLIFVQKNVLILEPPSEFQQHFARMSETERRHMKEKEFSLLEARQSKKLAAVAEAIAAGDASGNEVAAAADGKEKNKKKNMLQVKDRPRFKRKRAKGPNPLSCKKKKKVIQASPAVSHESKDGKVSAAKKRSRHRRSRRNKVASVGEPAQ